MIRGVAASSEGPRLAVLSRGAAALPQCLGGFSAIERVASPGNAHEDLSERYARAAQAAMGAGCDWFVALADGERLRPDALAVAEPAFEVCDAVFGAVRVTGSGSPVWRPSRLQVDEAARLPHALLHWWIGETAFVRTSTALTLFAQSAPPRSRIDVLFDLFERARAIKLAAPLFDLAEAPTALSETERDEVLARLDREPVFLTVRDGATIYRLPYTGRNAGIEREQTRGRFFEADELNVLRERIGPGARIADIGANTGNHTVWFAGPMQAKCVVPFEPLPQTAAILARTVRENKLGNVDLARLGVGVSDRPSRMRAVTSEHGGLGAARLEDDRAGEIAVAPLDEILKEPLDFLKIDVESMELKVLAGAAATIARWRPVIFIEIANDNAHDFMGWLNGAHYGIERIFSDKGHSNVLISPKGI